MPLNTSKKPSSGLSTAQTKLYWREWGAARRVLVENMHFDSAEANDERHEIHRDTLGKDKSSKDFTNRDLDKVLASFRAISRPEDSQAQIKAMEGELDRIRWKINELAQEHGWNEGYLHAVAIKICKVDYNLCNAFDLKKILSALTYQSKRLKKAS